MGVLAQAAQAPWQGATSEQDAAYAQSVAAMNMDTESHLKAVTGPVGQLAIDMEAAGFIDAASTGATKGFYIPPSRNEEKLIEESNTPRMKQAGGPQLQKDWVYAQGAGSATDRIYAHEFRHKYFQHKGMRDEPINDKRLMKTFDGYRADTKEEFLDAVGSWASNYAKYSEDPIGDFKREISRNQVEFLQIEEEAAKELKWVPKGKKFMWFFDKKGDIGTDLQEAYDLRRAKWEHTQEDTDAILAKLWSLPRGEKDFAEYRARVAENPVSDKAYSAMVKEHNQWVKRRENINTFVRSAGSKQKGEARYHKLMYGNLDNMSPHERDVAIYLRKE